MMRIIFNVFPYIEVGERVESPNQPPVRRLGSETWQSGEQDTSQVSVSSLPEDERSEEPLVASVTERTVSTDEQITSTQVTTHVSTEELVDIRVEHKGMY